MNSQLQASLAEKLIGPQEEISFRSMVTKVYMRPKLFLICVFVPPILAIIFASMVPLDWRASTKILIRYSSTESPFLKGLIPDNRLLLSGSSSAELLKSTPTIALMVAKVGVQSEDVYHKPMDMVTSRVSRMFKSKDEQDENTENTQTKIAQVSRAVKDSLEGSSSTSSKSKSVEILEKSSQVPDTMKGDELLSLEVRSFNREKVADMANGLANAFIDEYYRISAEDAHKSYLFLSDLVDKAEKDVQTIENTDDAQLESGTTALTSVLEQTRRENPLLNNMSRQLTDMETALMQSQQVYSNSSTKVIRLREDVERLKQSIKKEERLDTSKQVLEQLKVRKYQAYNTENLYKNRLIPISIVESAITPKPSSSKVVMKYAVSGVVGLLLGTILGVSLIVILSIIDPKLYTREEIKKVTSIPVLAALPKFRIPYQIKTRFKSFKVDNSIETGLQQILGHIGTLNPKAKATTIALTSPSPGDGVSFISMAITNASAKHSRLKVVLIDSNLSDQGLSKHFNLQKADGLMDAVINQQPLAAMAVRIEHLNVDFIPTGNVEHKTGISFHHNQLLELMAQLQREYDLIVIDSGATLTGNEAALFKSVVDSYFLVVSSGQTRKGAFRGALEHLSELNIEVSGIILNKYKLILPRFIYENL